MASSLLLLLLLSLLSSVTSLSPRVSFTLDSEDRPLIHLKLPDVHNTTTLLLSDDASTLYVGARDALLSLDVSQSDVISLKRKVDWRPSSSEIHNCEIKGKNATVDCPNFVRVLQLLNSTHLYTCGSFAFSPQEGVIDIQTFTLVPLGEGKGRCPFNPFQRSTAITVDGELFTATTSDFRGVKPQISRHLSTDQRPDVSQETSVSSLEEPTFVSSSLDAVEKKLYFFFSEVGREFSFVDQLQIARVAQVCKDDVGGQRTLQKKWTSFAKAPLLCQSPRQLPFNVLQDVFTLTGDGGHAPDTLFYGIFTSQWSSSPHSAVCVFRLQDVKTVFAGSYKTFNMETHQWSPLLGNHPYLGKCGLGGATDTELAEVKKSFLTSNPVQPVSDGPVLVSSDQQYSRVVAMRTTAANNKQYTVLYLLTESGLLHRVVLFDGGARVVEEVQVFTQPQLVKSMVLSPTKGVLYVGTSEGVTGIPVANCSAYRTCGQCVLARDPLCGWSLSRRVCSRVEGGDENMVQDLENSSVDERCQHQTRAQQDTDVIIQLNEAVTLQCLKPSNMAALTWTSTQRKKLPEKLFIQSADGSLRFIASGTTLGTYHCEVEEDGYKEVVTSYRVRQVAPPRSIRPSPMADDHVSNNKDEPFEDITTEGPLVSEPSGDPEDEEDTFTTNLKDETTISSKDSGLKNQGDPDRPVTSRRETQSWGGPVHVAPEQKSYHTELVVVSVLLVLCLITMAMGALHLWRRRRTSDLRFLLDTNSEPDDELRFE